jgi:heparinase II/III-like protein
VVNSAKFRTVPIGRRAAPFALAFALLASAGSATARPGIHMSDLEESAAAAATGDCASDLSQASTTQRSDDLLANRYTLWPHPTVTLPSSLTWREDPLGDDNWKFQFHTLRFVRYLMATWGSTALVKYRDRAANLMWDWWRDNPRSNPASPWSWNDHSTAWRAMMYACFYRALGSPTWARSALLTHGSALASPSFYVWHGNHALNQSIGLLDVACLLGRSDWKSLAAQRLSTLIGESIDVQGVTNEQAVGYQLYNYNRYNAARSRLLACGQPVPSSFARLSRMPLFLAHATLPNGHYEMLGDTDDGPAQPIRGTPAEFAATLGTAGPKPSSELAVYTAGFAFGRSGWGETRPFTDEVSFALRFGPARRFHGHLDGGAITMYGYGSRLLLDSGRYTYNYNAYRSYFAGRSAHNIVSVDGVAFDPARSTTRTALRTSTTHFELAVRHLGYPGVDSRRRMIFSRRLNYVLVYDQLFSSVVHRYRQLWHLREDANPWMTGISVGTRRPRGNVLIRQLYGWSTNRLVTGSTNPIQGWLSYRFGVRKPNPTVEVIKSGASVRYLTVLVPDDDGRFSVSFARVRTSSSGFSADITVNGRTERVTATATSSSVVPLN